MKKLKLDLNELKVESFETSKQSIRKGTVNGHATVPVGFCADQSYHTYCPTSACLQCSGELTNCNQNTCDYTECNQNTCDTCYNTCDGYGPTCIYPECLY
jgi:hypothetical protein